MINAHALEAFEREIRYSLPLDYREFLLTVNGGSPNRCLFVCGEFTVESVVNFFPLRGIIGASGPGFYAEGSLESIWHSTREFLPENMVPVAEDGGGNFLLLCWGDQPAGSVHFFDHEIAGYREGASEEALLPAAHSFRELIESLEDEDANLPTNPAFQLAIGGDLPAAVEALKNMRFEVERRSVADQIGYWAASSGKIHTCIAVLPWLRNPTNCVHAAVAAGHAETVRQMLLAQTTRDVELRQGPFDYTLLHEVATTENVEVARVLIELGANVNAKAQGKVTPLSRAKAFGRSEMERFLRKAGATE